MCALFVGGRGGTCRAVRDETGGGGGGGKGVNCELEGEQQRRHSQDSTRIGQTE